MLSVPFFGRIFFFFFKVHVHPFFSKRECRTFHICSILSSYSILWPSVTLPFGGEQRYRLITCTVLCCVSERILFSLIKTTTATKQHTPNVSHKESILYHTAVATEHLLRAGQGTQVVEGGDSAHCYFYSHQRFTSILVSSIMATTTGKCVGEYVLGEKLGEGTFGAVFRATHTNTGELVAIKQLSRSRVMQSNMVTQFRREIDFMRLIDSPYAVKFHRILVTSNNFYVVMALVDGPDMSKLLERPVGGGSSSSSPSASPPVVDPSAANANATNRATARPLMEKVALPEAQARLYFAQLLAGVAYLHRRGIAHRDLKPANLLLDRATDTVKIADFGLANTQDPSEIVGVLRTACGTALYVAPEVIGAENTAGYNGHRADMWGCGVILYEMITGRFPFEDGLLMRQTVILQKIRAGVYSTRGLPAGALDIISRLLVLDPARRATAAELLSHPWLLSGGSSVGGDNDDDDDGDDDLLMGVGGGRRRVGRGGGGGCGGAVDREASATAAVNARIQRIALEVRGQPLSPVPQPDRSEEEVAGAVVMLS